MGSGILISAGALTEKHLYFVHEMVNILLTQFLSFHTSDFYSRKRIRVLAGRNYCMYKSMKIQGTKFRKHSGGFSQSTPIFMISDFKTDDHQYPIKSSLLATPARNIPSPAHVSKTKVRKEEILRIENLLNATGIKGTEQDRIT